jgi:hypothetical protein
MLKALSLASMTHTSLISPIHNKIQLLPRLLDTVDVAWECFGIGIGSTTDLSLALGYWRWKLRIPSTGDKV